MAVIHDRDRRIATAIEGGFSADKQISAIQRALDRVALELVSDHTRECVIGASGQKREERTEELLQALDRLVSKR